MSADIFRLADGRAEGHERARDLAVARFLLDAANDLGVRVGTNGDEIATLSTSRTSFEMVRWLERELAKNKRRVIEFILREAARRGVAP
jgi:hypothetical protein